MTIRVLVLLVTIRRDLILFLSDASEITMMLLIVVEELTTETMIEIMIAVQIETMIVIVEVTSVIGTETEIGLIATETETEGEALNVIEDIKCATY